MGSHKVLAESTSCPRLEMFDNALSRYLAVSIQQQNTLLDTNPLSHALRYTLRSLITSGYQRDQLLHGQRIFMSLMQ